MQQVDEALAAAGVLGSRVRREYVECHNASGWGEGEEGAVEPAAWGGFYRGAVIGICVWRESGDGGALEYRVEGEKRIRGDDVDTELEARGWLVF